MAGIVQTPGVDVRYTAVYIICVMFVVAGCVTSSTRCNVMQVHQQRVHQQLVVDVVINRRHQDPRRRSPLAVVIMAELQEGSCVRDLVRAPGWRGSRDGIRTVEAGYRAVAHQTVTNCRAERSIWDDTGSFGLMFCCK